ncbi:MAG: calcium-binding protein [Alphaproteobacteria bacterium]|nr:calcium-binding protein [Alphaproteobacteria bacterium]
MARLTAYYGFDQLSLDFNILSRQFVDLEFLDNSYLQTGGVTYEDSLAVFYESQGWLMGAGFAGRGFRLGEGDVLLGTVNAVEAVVIDMDVYDVNWVLSGLQIPLADIFDAIYTPSVTDDWRLLDRMLAGNDLFNLSFQADRAFGMGGHDTLFGEGGDDTLSGGIGNDQLFGGVGSDMLMLDAGDDALYGGIGQDVVVVDGTRAARIDLALTVRQDTGYGRDIITGIEDAVGGLGNDTLSGNAQANILMGVGGHDRLSGRAGEDLLDGGAGNDRLDGGTGNDLLLGGGGDDLLLGGSGADTLRGGSGNDQLFLDGGADVLEGGAGTDWLIHLGSGGVSVDLGVTVAQDTGLGLDRIMGVENLRGGSGADRLSGNGQNNVIQGGGGFDVIAGGSGNDRLEGQAGNDRLDGGSGRDSLSGGVGNDRLIGGTGADVLTGGGNADIFVFRSLNDSTVSARDVIADFQRGQDRIDLSAIDADHLVRGNNAFTVQSGGSFESDKGGQLLIQRSAATNVTDVLMDVNGDGIADAAIRLQGLHVLSAGDFIL